MTGAAKFSRFCSVDDESGADSGGGGDNTGGNAGTQRNDSSGQDNSGTGFDASAFWNEPVVDKSTSPSGGSADSGSTATGTQQAPNKGQQFATEFAQKLDSLPMGKDPFSPEVIAELAEGKTEGINTALQSMGREAVRQSVMMNAQLMSAFGDQLMTRMEALVEAKLGNRDNSSTLLENFPSAKDPAMRPMIQGVFDQSMKHTNGDRVKAVAMTKDMLKFLGKTGASDLGIDTPPTSPGDTMTPGAKSLVEQLLTRG